MIVHSSLSHWHHHSTISCPYYYDTVNVMGGSQESVLGIITCNELDDLGYKPPMGRRSDAPIQISPKAHPASVQGNLGLFPRGIRQLRLWL
jgi:hypothetical protein